MDGEVPSNESAKGVVVRDFYEDAQAPLLVNGAGEDMQFVIGSTS